MSSHTSFSMQTDRDTKTEKKTYNYYVEMNERLKLVNCKMQELEKNFKNLSESSTELAKILPPLLLHLKTNLFFEHSE